MKVVEGRNKGGQAEDRLRNKMAALAVQEEDTKMPLPCRSTGNPGGL